MVPATSNRDIANFTVDEMLHSVPEIFGIKSFFKKLVICLLEERVRVGMMQPEQPWYLGAFVKGVMCSVAFGHRYLSLPRWKDGSVVNRTRPKARMYPNKYVLLDKVETESLTDGTGGERNLGINRNRRQGWARWLIDFTFFWGSTMTCLGLNTRAKDTVWKNW